MIRTSKHAGGRVGHAELTVARRRARNKTARASRRLNRGAK